MRKIIRSILEKTGFRKINNGVIPKIYDDPIEALHYKRGGMHVAFKCPLKSVRHPNGLSLSPNSSHPFIKTIEQYQSNETLCYNNSILKEYFNSWLPRNASEAIVGFKFLDNNLLSNLPSHLLYMAPWSSRTSTQWDNIIQKWVINDIKEHYGSIKNFNDYVFNIHGPVYDQIGHMEFERLIKCYNKLYKFGYDRQYGDAKFIIIKKESDYIFLLHGAYHRTAVMSSLNKDYIPAQFHPSEPDLLDIKDVEYWPQVRSGAWTERDAIRYVEHLFEFDDNEWFAKYCLKNYE